MKFFGTAMSEDRKDFIAKEFDADTFEDALSELRRLAIQRWPGTLWRPTCLVESPKGPAHHLTVAINPPEAA